MEIKRVENGAELTLAIVGRLDTASAPQLDEVVKTSLEGISTLILDFEELEYISSSGLRVLLASQKIMNKQGKMIVKNVCDNIKEILDITGFNDILTIV